MRRAGKQAQQAMQQAVQGMQVAAQSVEHGLIMHGSVAATTFSEAWVMSVRDLVTASKAVCSAHMAACLDMKHGLMSFGLETFQMLRLPLSLALAGFLLLVCNEVYKGGGLLGHAAGGAGVGFICMVVVVFAIIVAEYVRLRGDHTQTLQALQKEDASRRIAEEREADIEARCQQMQNLISQALEMIDEANKISEYDGTATANYWGDPNLRGRQHALQKHLQEAKAKLVLARGGSNGND